jgi:hypothetical protein
MTITSSKSVVNKKLGGRSIVVTSPSFLGYANLNLHVRLLKKPTTKGSITTASFGLFDLKPRIINSIVDNQTFVLVDEGPKHGRSVSNKCYNCKRFGHFNVLNYHQSYHTKH